MPKRVGVRVLRALIPAPSPPHALRIGCSDPVDTRTALASNFALGKNTNKYQQYRRQSLFLVFFFQNKQERSDTGTDFLLLPKSRAGPATLAVPPPRAPPARSAVPPPPLDDSQPHLSRPRSSKARDTQIPIRPQYAIGRALPATGLGIAILYVLKPTSRTVSSSSSPF